MWSKRKFYKWQNKVKVNGKSCHYPFTPDCFGYCWGYANLIDKTPNPTNKEILKLCKNCEYWK